jgi:hypothetical protein
MTKTIKWIEKLVAVTDKGEDSSVQQDRREKSRRDNLSERNANRTAFFGLQMFAD